MMCWRHNWADWVATDSGDVIDSVYLAPVGRYLHQQRHCLKCGKVQIDHQRSAKKNGWSVYLRSDKPTQKQLKKDGVA